LADWLQIMIAQVVRFWGGVPEIFGLYALFSNFAQQAEPKLSVNI